MGSEFVDVLMAMVAWGDRWTAGDAGPPVLYRHRSCGQITHVEPHCAACGEILRSADVDVEPGSGLAAANDHRNSPDDKQRIPLFVPSGIAAEATREAVSLGLRVCGWFRPRVAARQGRG